MARRLIGQTSVGRYSTKVKSGALRTEVESLITGNNPRMWYERVEEFDGATLPSPWATKIVGTTPTVAKLANTANGVWRALLAATSEAETAGFDFGDSLILNDPTAGTSNPNEIGVPNVEMWVRFPTALTTAQTVVIGVATAFNATLTSISKYAWIRFTASMVPLLEGKDGTTTTLAQAAAGTSTVTLVANTFYLFTIEFGEGRAKFSIDDNVLGTVPMGALVPTDNLQPVAYVAKSSGVTTPALDIDFALIRNWRY